MLYLGFSVDDPSFIHSLLCSISVYYVITDAYGCECRCTYM